MMFYHLKTKLIVTLTFGAFSFTIVHTSVTHLVSAQ